MVQKAVAWVLGAVFEQDFLECSHGFRPKRSPHTALHRMREGMRLHGVRYVVEVDLASYFVPSTHCTLVIGEG
jgi:retron-type reverse transcriptase